MIELQHTQSGEWLDVTTDVLADASLSIRYGIQGSGPLDRIASTGFCQFTLANWSLGAGFRPQGYYTPGHINMRSGFGLGMRCRVTFRHAGINYVKHYGKLVDIRPMPGKYLQQRVAVTSADWINDLATFAVRDIDPQTNKRTDELIQAVIDAMPTGAQPPQVADLDTGLDTYTYAFDDLKNGAWGLSVVARTALSEIGYFYVKGDGTPRFENRQATIGATSLIALTDDDLQHIEVPTSIADTFNRGIVTIHPRRVDASAVVLFTQSTDDPPSLAAGEVRTFTYTYRDPNQLSTTIGGKDFVAPVATTDYTANTQADGLGVDKTSALTVSVDFRASLAMVTLTNTDAGTIYVTSLQGRGKGIYDLTPETFDKTYARSYGDRPLTLDMPYQGDRSVGEALSNYLASQFISNTGRAKSVGFNPQASYSAMLAAMRGEPGSVFTAQETMTAIGASLRVNGVELTVTPSLWLSLRWTAGPNITGDPFIIGDPDKGLIGTGRLGSL